MKSPSVGKIIALLAISTTIAALTPAAEASSNKYSCQKINNDYYVSARTIRGNMNMLNFKRNVSEQWSAEKRCQTVAQRFQTFYDNDILRYIGAGHVNQSPVLCAVAEKGDLCNSKNILVTLPNGTDPVLQARKLMDIRGLSRGRLLEVSGKDGKLESYINGNAYYDLEILEQLFIEAENNNGNPGR